MVRILTFTLFIQEALTLKDKRQIVKSLIARTRNKFNVSMAEIGFLDQWQRSQLELAYVGNDPVFMDQVQQELIKFIESGFPVEITDLAVDNY